MKWIERQTPIDISDCSFPRFKDSSGRSTERFWFVKEQFVKHASWLLNEGKSFSHVGARMSGSRWISDCKPVTEKDIAHFVWKLRLFYLKSECMSIPSVCLYMESNVRNRHIQLFFRHMRKSWEEALKQPAALLEGYTGKIKTNKQLIDTLLYSGNFHCQEKYDQRYNELLGFMDDSLILMCAYNAMHNGYQMNQISRVFGDLTPGNPVILLPDHLRHEWDRDCPYNVIR
ncbi:hypothetical protein [Microbulbifer sp. M83]|uniref:hypothetical protein n=1 Tax=Microbulbifer sp. M83 TaxID=3118246 RepID=UPI002FE3FE30